jgi:hypothetical protein
LGESASSTFRAKEVSIIRENNAKYRDGKILSMTVVEPMGSNSFTMSSSSVVIKEEASKEVQWKSTSLSCVKY